MPQVHLGRAQQQHSNQAQPQQLHQANQAPSSNFAASPSEQPQAVTSSSSVPYLSYASQEPSVATEHQHQQLQPSQQQQPPHSQQQLSSPHSQIENISQAQSAAVGTTTSECQNGEGRKISCEDIQLVQNLIERCLQLYMNQGEVISTLLNQAKIEPGFTRLVWQKLEEQNSDFFKAYYTRLKLKKHIILFNDLLEHQVQLLQKMRLLPTKTTLSPSPVSNHPSIQTVPVGFPMPQQSPLTGSGHAHAASMCFSPKSPSLLHSGLHMQDNFQLSHESPGQRSTFSGIVEMMKVPSVLHSSGSGLNADLQLGSVSAIPSGAFPFDTIRNSLDMSSVGISTPMPPDNSFCTQDSQAQNISLKNVDGDEKSSTDLLGALSQLPRNFSLSDLTAELGPHSGAITDPHFTFFEKL